MAGSAILPWVISPEKHIEEVEDVFGAFFVIKGRSLFSLLERTLGAPQERYRPIALVLKARFRVTRFVHWRVSKVLNR